ATFVKITTTILVAGAADGRDCANNPFRSAALEKRPPQLGEVVDEAALDHAVEAVLHDHRAKQSTRARRIKGLVRTSGLRLAIEHAAQRRAERSEMNRHGE